MNFADRVKETTSATGTSTITLSGAAAGFRTFAASFAVGATGIPVGVDDGAGNWENGVYTLTNATTLTREVVTSSSNNGQAVTFAAGQKTVFCTLTAAGIASLPSVNDIAFTTSVPLTRLGSSYMPQQAVSGSLTFTPAANAVRGALVYLRLIADGSNAPTFSGFKEWGGSLGYDNRNGIVNAVQFFCDGVDNWFSVSLAVNATPAPVAASAVTLSGPTSGVVSTASSAFSVGVSPVGGAITGTVTVTPNDGGASGTFSPTSVNLTSASPTATFTYTPSSTGSKTISVTNNGNLSNPASNSYSVSAAATAPGAPTIGTPTAGDGSVSVPFTAPSSNGGSAITGYTVTAYKASDNSQAATAPGTSSPITVSGLTNGTAYYFKVAATNGVGPGSQSAASNSVTPAAAEYLRFGSLTRIVESGAGPYTYAASGAGSGFGTTEGDAVLTKAFQSGVDGEFIVKALSTPSGSNNEIFIGVDASSATGLKYSDIDYGAVGHPSTYVQFANGTQGSTTNTGSAVNDQVKVRRVGSTLTMLLSKDGGATFPTTVASWTGVPTGVLYIHMLATGAAGFAPVSQTGLA